MALTNDDEDNLMVSVLVEKFAKDNDDLSDKRTMALINKPNYSLLQTSLKIDDFIDPRMNTVSSILKHIHKGTIENAYSILNGEYEIIEAEIIETSSAILFRVDCDRATDNMTSSNSLSLEINLITLPIFSNSLN